MVEAEELLEHARGRALIGDTGYGSNAFMAAVHPNRNDGPVAR